MADDAGCKGELLAESPRLRLGGRRVYAGSRYFSKGGVIWKTYRCARSAARTKPNALARIVRVKTEGAKQAANATSRGFACVSTIGLFQS